MSPRRSFTFAPIDNPHTLEYEALRRARWRRWRAQPVEPLMGLLIALALLATMLWAAAAQTERWAAWAAALAPHPMLLLTSVSVLIALYTASTGLHELKLWRDGWLGTLSTPSLRRQALWHRHGRRCVAVFASVAVISTTLHWTLSQNAGLPQSFWWALPFAAAAATMTAWPWLRRAAALEPHGAVPSASAGILHAESASAPADHHHHPMTLARWALREQLASLRSRRFALWLALPLLLIPGGGGMRDTLALLASGIMASAGLAGWQRGARLLIRASAWLRAQPIGAALLPPLLWPMALFALVALAGALCGPAVMGLQAAVLLVVGLSVAGLATLQACALAAWRHEPSALRLRFPAAVCFLLLLVQSVAPLTPLAWALLCGYWLYKARLS